jgi:hypothetical protein
MKCRGTSHTCSTGAAALVTAVVEQPVTVWAGDADLRGDGQQPALVLADQADVGDAVVAGTVDDHQPFGACMAS